MRTRKDVPDKWKEYGRFEIGLRYFDAELELSKHYGVAKALNGGRILSYLLSEDGVAIAYYHEGIWDIRFDDDDEEAKIANAYFMARFNKKRDKRTERRLYYHVYN